MSARHFGRDASALLDAITAARRHARPETPLASPRVPWLARRVRN